MVKKAPLNVEFEFNSISSVSFLLLSWVFFVNVAKLTVDPFPMDMFMSTVEVAWVFLKSVFSTMVAVVLS